MNKILFSGCSLPAGVGLEREKNDNSNYVNVFANDVFGESVTVNNIAIPGNSNLRTFLNTCTELVNEKYDYVFVCWTSYPRLVVWPGLEEYDTRRTLNAARSRTITEHQGSRLMFTEKFLTDLSDNISLVQNAHYDILDIIQYINILIKIAEQSNTKIYFINNMCWWDRNFFDPVPDNHILPSNLTPYTNQVLESNFRDDPQIERLYKKMHKDYKDAGGIQQAHWLNLYNNFIGQIVDKGLDKVHPGPKSHIHYGKYLAQQFKQVI